jgi:hypothetical protein
MKKKYYKCDNCEQTFGRKWNALRHSKLTHSSSSDITSINIKPKTSLKSRNKYHNYQMKFDILNQTDIEMRNVYDKDQSDIFDLNKQDIKIIKIIDQLVKPFNELEQLLIYENLETRAFILTKSFDQSIQSPNPVRTMNEMVELLRSLDGIKKIAKYRSMVDQTILDPISDIKDKIKNSFLFERQNN